MSHQTTNCVLGREKTFHTMCGKSLKELAWCIPGGVHRLLVGEHFEVPHTTDMMEFRAVLGGIRTPEKTELTIEEAALHIHDRYVGDGWQLGDAALLLTYCIIHPADVHNGPIIGAGSVATIPAKFDETDATERLILGDAPPLRLMPSLKTDEARKPCGWVSELQEPCGATTRFLLVQPA